MAVPNVPLPVQTLSQPFQSSFAAALPLSSANQAPVRNNSFLLQRPMPKMNKTARDKQWWTKAEDDKLRDAVASCGARNWKLISEIADVGKSDVQCLQRWTQVLRPGLKKGTWSKDEDHLLVELVDKHKTRSHTEPFKECIPWKKIEKDMGGRTAKQCRERWKLSLDPTINKSMWTPEEDRQLLNFQRELGNSWSQIKDLLGTNRTENSVKLRFKCLKKREEKFKRNLERIQQQQSSPDLISYEESEPPAKKLRTHSLPALPLDSLSKQFTYPVQNPATNPVSNFSNVFINEDNTTRTLFNTKSSPEMKRDGRNDNEAWSWTNSGLDSLYHAAELSAIKTEECSKVGLTPIEGDRRSLDAASNCDGDKTPVVPYDDSHGSSGSFSRQDSLKSIEFDEVVQILSDGTP